MSDSAVPGNDPNDPLLLPTPVFFANPDTYKQFIYQQADLLGLTYQQIANAMAAQYKKCGCTTGDCFSALYYQLLQEFDKLQGIVATVWDAVGNDVTLTWPTLCSAMQCTIDGAFQDLDKVLGELKPGQCAKINNSGSTPQGLWQELGPDGSPLQIPLALPNWYTVDKNGDVVGGAKWNSDGTITTQQYGTTDAADFLIAQTTSTFQGWGDAPGFCDSYSLIPACGTSGGGGGTITGPPPLCPPDKFICADFSCVDDPAKCPENQVKPPPPPPPPTTCPPTKVTCPSPVVNVQVSPTPIVVNVAPCNPAPPIIENIVKPPEVIIEPGIGVVTPPDEWEPDVQDVVEQMLNDMGFPKDFVEYFGGIADAQLLSFEEQVTTSPDDGNGFA